MWDASSDGLRPVLVLDKARGPVRSLAVMEEMGLLAAGHANGKVRFCTGGAWTRAGRQGSALRAAAGCHGWRRA